MVAAHAITIDAADADGCETGWRLCGADEQTGGRVYDSGAVPLSLSFSIPFRAVNSQHTPRARDLFYFFQSTLIPTTLHLVWLDQILGADRLLDFRVLGAFLTRCQYKFGGIGKPPDEHPDPYHRYLSIAAAAITSPDPA
ncbi:hypothetical protein BGW80DRAFT_1327583 [Lactifluus volemus]|nr:hypothetical protein BGW80DRAFT_1327583 [Lactifluus volemus]